MTISNGAILVDCTGIDLMSSESVTIEGLYSKLQSAISNPNISLINLKFSGLMMTPCKVRLLQLPGYITATIYRVCTISVTSADVVTITFLS